MTALQFAIDSGVGIRLSLDLRGAAYIRSEGGGHVFRPYIFLRCSFLEILVIQVVSALSYQFVRSCHANSDWRDSLYLRV
jgi:hypothetical protein